ncbi:hypothetical protein TNCV_2556091 [Trichonephila clavipes]|nr:hypothetical protein TNCV_2556091 [Trichonephila clavipes]
MIVQFRNEKVSNHGSIPITIDCNVVAFIVFEEGFHQPIKRTKQSLRRSPVREMRVNSGLEKTPGSRGCKPMLKRALHDLLQRPHKKLMEAAGSPTLTYCFERNAVEILSHDRFNVHQCLYTVSLQQHPNWIPRLDNSGPESVTMTTRLSRPQDRDLTCLRVFCGIRN